MKTIVLGLLGAVALVALPSHPAHAHRPGFSIGIGYGYGYPPYWGGFGFYPSIYYNVAVAPRPPARKQRDAEVRMQKLYVYPAGGQSEEQMSTDQYQCHVWAVDATDFDPTLGAGTAAEAENYGRAFTACMEGRGYVVK